MIKGRTPGVLLLAMNLAIGVSVGVRAEAQDPALAEAREWVQMVDEGAWQASWLSAAPIFQDGITVDDWAEAAQSAREPLGALVERGKALVKHHETLPGAPAGPYKVVQFHSTFDAAGGVIETVSLRKIDLGWKVSGYFVRRKGSGDISR